MLDYSEKIKFEPVEARDYELKIDSAEFKKNEAGKKYISIRYLIRKDVNQPNAGRFLFDSIWEGEVHRDKNGKVLTKEKYDALSTAEKSACVTTVEYNSFKIRSLVQAQDVDPYIGQGNNKTENPEYKTRFDNIEEVVLFLNGMNILARVNKEFDDKQGEEKNTIDYKNIKRTKVHEENTAVNNGSGLQVDIQPQTVNTEEIDDSDLPF